MKKITRTLDLSFPPVRIEVDALIEGLSPVLNDKSKVTVIFGDHAYESLEELAKLANVDFVAKCAIEVITEPNAPGILITFSDDEVRLSVRSEWTPAISHVVALLRRNVPWTSYWPVKAGAAWFILEWISTISLYAAIGYVFLLYSGISMEWFAIPIGSGFLLAQFLSLERIGIRFGRSRIWIAPKSSRRSWFNRHRDDLLKHLVVAVLTAVVTVAVTKMVE